MARRRVVEWVLAGLLVAAIGYALVQVVALTRTLDDIRTRAASRAALSRRVLASADSLRALARARRDTISRLTLSRDSLRIAFAARRATIPPRPTAPVSADCAPWIARADSLAGALAVAEAAEDLSDAVIASQRAAVHDLDGVAELLTPALTAAAEDLEAIAATPRPGRPSGPRLAAFAEASAGIGGLRAQAGLQRGHWSLTVEDGPAGRGIRLAVRHTLRLF